MSTRIAHNVFARNGKSERVQGSFIIADNADAAILRQHLSWRRPGGVRAVARGDAGHAAPRQLLRRASGSSIDNVSRASRPAGSRMTTVFQRVGPYEIDREIGRGGMASVFLATDSRTGRRVALKLVPTGTDREAHDILDAERWGAKLQEQFCKLSGHVPAVYEYDTDGQYFYIAMEYLEGRNLSEVITGGPLAPERAVRIAIQLCHFLEAAHAFEATIEGRPLRSLLHGDLKPRNIRVLDGDQVKVLDFGIAKALSLSRKVTRNDFGSIAYLSPERLESGDMDAHADFWAVGVLLYEMVAGVQPFRAADTRRLEQLIRSLQPAASARCRALS